MPKMYAVKKNKKIGYINDVGKAWMENDRYVIQMFVKRIAGLLAGLFIFMVITHILNEMYVDAEGMTWYRILWHHYYEDAGKIDSLYLGSSHVYSDIDPSVLDRLSGKYNFNMATPLQRVNGSYYLLREAARKNELRHVYLEMNYECIIDDSVLPDCKRNWCNTDYMKPSINKAAYILAIGGADEYVDILLPFIRYRVSLGDWEYIKTELEIKGQEDYRDYRYAADSGETYEPKGFRTSTRVYGDSRKIFSQQHILSGYSLEKRNESYCRQIIEYCQKKEIPITLFVSPINDLQLISTLAYDDYRTEIKELASEYGVPFYDFNLARAEYLPIWDGKYFRDAGHLNQDGAELFTPFFYQVVSGDEADNKTYFYDSYAEKLNKLPPEIYGLYFREAGDGEERKTMWIASNRDEGMEYRIILTPSEGEQYMVQDFSENKEFSVPTDEKGICTIVMRMAETPDEVQTIEINY